MTDKVEDFRRPAKLAVELACIRVDQKLVRIEAKTLRRGIPAMYPIPVSLTGPAAGQMAMPDIVCLFGKVQAFAFPAILIGLVLQAVLFQFGGLTSLGVNTLNMALPAVICSCAFRAGIKSENMTLSMTTSFLCGFGAVLLGSLMLAASLVFTGEHFLVVAKIAVIAHLPVMVIEGLIAALCVRFLRRVKPEVLEVVYEQQN